jgi:hypothetical protein
MTTFWKALLIGLLTLALSAGPVLAYDPAQTVTYDQEQAGRDPSGAEMFADTLMARPLGLLAMVLGVATFVVSLPFTLPSGSADSANKALVRAPTVFTFKRPLGRFVSCEEQPEMCR